jgi:hypothetical protein
MMKITKPIKHIVLVKFTDTTSNQMVAEISQAFEALPSMISGITAFEAGRNVSLEGLSKGFTHAFVMTFIDASARDAYLPHEQHQAFVTRLKLCLEDVLVIDYTLD